MNESITSSMVWRGTYATGRMQVDRGPRQVSQQEGREYHFLIIYPHHWRRLREEMWNIYPGVKGLMGTYIYIYIYIYNENISDLGICYGSQRVK